MSYWLQQQIKSLHHACSHQMTGFLYIVYFCSITLVSFPKFAPPIVSSIGHLLLHVYSHNCHILRSQNKTLRSPVVMISWFNSWMIYQTIKYTSVPSAVTFCFPSLVIVKGGTSDPFSHPHYSAAPHEPVIGRLWSVYGFWCGEIESMKWEGQ